jgi:hypothetical protein
MDLNVYKRKLGATSTSQALVNATRRQVRSMFTNSPLYRTIILNGVEKGVRLSFEKDGEHQILLMPEEPISKGDIADIDGNKWLVFETVQDIAYPKGKIRYCNQSLNWTDSLGVSHEYPAIVTGKSYDLEEDKYMSLSEGQAIAIVSYNADTKTIKLSERFILGDNAYEVIGVDNITHVVKDSGLLLITLERTSKADTDDEVTDVADNTTDNGWGGGW